MRPSPIAVQAAARGIALSALVGRSAAELRADGFEVPPWVLDTAVLDTRCAGEPVLVAERTADGRGGTLALVREGVELVWRGWRPTGAAS